MAPKKISPKRKLTLQKAREAKSQKMSLPEEVATTVPMPETTVPMPEMTSPPSASKAKLESFSVSVEETPDKATLATAIVQLDTLQHLLQMIPCPKCNEGKLELVGDTAKNVGLAVFLMLKCYKCKHVLGESYTSIKTGKTFDINKRLVAASLATGLGHGSVGKFLELMDVPNLHQQSYASNTSLISQQLPSYKDTILHLAVDKVKAAYPEQGAQEIVDIDVSYDGSWQTRGHIQEWCRVCYRQQNWPCCGL